MGRCIGWDLDSMKGEAQPMEDAHAKSRLTVAQRPPIASSGFTPVNQSLPFKHARQRTTQSHAGEPPQNIDHGSHTGATTPFFVIDYLNRDDITNDVCFGRRAPAPTRTRSDEDFYGKKASSLKTSRKRASVGAPNPAKKAQTSSQKSVADGMRVTKSSPKITKSNSVFEPKALTNITNRIKPDSLSEAYNPSKQTMQKLGAWVYPYPSLSSSLSLTDVNPLNSAITSVSSDASPTSVSAITGYPHRPEIYKSNHFQVRKVFNVTQPVPSIDVVPQQPSRPIPSLPLVRSFLATMPEESNSLEDSTEVACRINSKFQFASIRSNRFSRKSDGTQEEPADLTDNFHDTDSFDGINDDDLLNFNFPEASDPAQSFNILSTRPTSKALPTPQTTDAPVASLALNAIADECDVWDIPESEEIDILDLTDDLLETLGLPPTPPAPISTHLPSTEITVPAPSPRCSESTVLFSDLSDPPDDYAKEILHPRIVRPLFPPPIRDRSPVVGVSATTCLRTCFRIGEALNAGCSAVRESGQATSLSILVELYAKVSSSHRDESGFKQYFTFADLFHEDKPPFITGACEYWKGSGLWENDCGTFLGSGGGSEKQEKKMCRVIGRMKREGKEWRFVVLNIWEATWDDVDYTREVVCG